MRRPVPVEPRRAKMPRPPAFAGSFTLKKTTVDDIARQIAKVYSGVNLGGSPMFRWVQIVNDTTILGEDVRRGRNAKAVERAGRILMRVLSFIGHYLHHQGTGPVNPANLSFGDFVSKVLRQPSYTDYFSAAAPGEGPTRWILAKYPFACAKCGSRPCRCLLEPWVFEERREIPGPFMKYRDATEQCRLKLKRNTKIEEFTLPGMVLFFNDLYRNSYYHQDPWKLTMHLAEELGEATIELSRLELAWMASTKEATDLKGLAEDIVADVKTLIDKECERIREPADERRIRKKAEGELRYLGRALRGKNPWDAFVVLVSEKFKEEMCDVFSWLSAIIAKLTLGKVEEELEAITKRYVKTKGHRQVLKCPWCGDEDCSNECLVEHEVSEELTEKALKM
jgi:hypothetical protein